MSLSALRRSVARLRQAGASGGGVATARLLTLTDPAYSATRTDAELVQDYQEALRVMSQAGPPHFGAALPVGEVDIDAHEYEGGTVLVRLSWRADASGRVSGHFLEDLACVLTRVLFIPGVDAERPLDGHRVTLLDGYGMGKDVLAGLGASLPGGEARRRTLDARPAGGLELRARAAGPGACGVLALYVREAEGA